LIIINEKNPVKSGEEKSEGISQVSRLILENIPIEVTEKNQRMFPIDNA